MANWMATLLFAPFFFILLILFHPLHKASQYISLEARENVLLWMNQFFVWGLRWFAGLRLQVRGQEHIAKLNTPQFAGRSVILISNHQSMYDISLILTVLKRGRIRFVAKRELGRWIPSISIALRNMEAALIDRDNRSQAVRVIKQFGVRAANLQRDVCIYPEGTRSRNGELLPFKALGVLTLLKTMPDSVVMPIAIKGSWRILRYGFWPVTYGARVDFVALEPLDPRELGHDQIVETAFTNIKEAFLSLK